MVYYVITKTIKTGLKPVSTKGLKTPEKYVLVLTFVPFVWFVV